MRVLALDTTRAAGSVALADDGRIVAERASDLRRSHAERLPADLIAIVEASHLSLADIDVFAVAAGPGSFTGLRIGIATMQGLAFASRRRVAAVSTLEAIAQAAGRDAPVGTRIGAWVDAHRREVFSALYEIRSAPIFSTDRLAEIEPPSVGEPAAILDRWRAARKPVALVAGDGAELYAPLVTALGASISNPALAAPVALMGVEMARLGRTLDPAGLQPIYIRRPDAEILRETRAGVGR